MITWITVWFLIVSESNSGYKYSVPYSNLEICQYYAKKHKNNWAGNQTMCIKGQLPIYIPKK